MAVVNKRSTTGEAKIVIRAIFISVLPKTGTGNRTGKCPQSCERTRSDSARKATKPSADPGTEHPSIVQTVRILACIRAENEASVVDGGVYGRVYGRLVVSINAAERSMYGSWYHVGSDGGHFTETPFSLRT